MDIENSPFFDFGQFSGSWHPWLGQLSLLFPNCPGEGSGELSSGAPAVFPVKVFSQLLLGREFQGLDAVIMIYFHVMKVCDLEGNLHMVVSPYAQTLFILVGSGCQF